MKINSALTSLILILYLSCPTNAQNNRLIISESKITDSRDMISYSTIILKKENNHSVEWFTENLKFQSRETMHLPYAHKASLGNFFGMFYEHDNLQTLCPKGWHVATEKDWITLIELIGGVKDVNSDLKTPTKWMDINNGRKSSGLKFLSIGFAQSGCGWSFDTDRSQAVFLVSDVKDDIKKVISFNFDNSIEIDKAYDNNLYNCRCVRD